MIEGRWHADDGIFVGYYWQDIQFYGKAWVPIKELE